MATLGSAERLVNASVAPTGAARLDELEAKRLRYEALGRKLFTLPHKLRHPGLIPVGPRLYLPGELINTNRLTVLLGSCNDEAYFAERSAFQAQGIVQRRLALIDEKAKEVEVGERELVHVLRDKGVENGTAERNALLPGPKVDIGEGKAKKAGRRVSFRDPVVTQVHVSENYKKKKKGKKFANQSNSSASKEQTKTKQVSSEQAPSEVEESTKRKEPAAHQSRSARQASKGKDISASTGPVSVKSSVSVEDTGANGRSEETSPSETDAASKRKAPKDEVTLMEEQRAVRSQLDEAIRNAERQALAQGVVNITEVFEDGADDPSRVELPEGFTPDSNISFGDDSEEFLDMTEGKAGKAQSAWDTDTASREDYFEAVMAAEREGDAENAKQEAEERQRRIQREQREFGKGFAKGFFGVPPVKSAKAKKAGAKAAESVAETVDISRQAERAADVRIEEEPVPKRVVGEEQSGVKERVVERRPTRRGARKARKPRASSILEMRGMPVTPVIPDVHGVEEESLMAMDGEEPVGDEARVSKFREIRNRQRSGSS